jgi:tetratricopeptide (TPR) repeat protein
MNPRRALTLTCAGLVIAGIVVFGRSTPVSAELRTPTDPAEVLERLPEGAARDPKAIALRRQRRALADQPRSLSVALRVASLEIRSAREQGDPRHLGRAQAALAPWWDAPDAPAEVLVLRATIEQSLHDFDAALRSLDRALALEPNAPQAWLTKAVVLTVRGRYDEARASCDALERVDHSSIPIAVCRTSIGSVTGDAKGAFDRLQSVLAQSNARPEEQAWALSCLGEYAERAGRAREAEDLYRRALALDPEDTYTRSCLADLLLDESRGAEVPALLAGRESNDALLLRLAIAEKQTRSPSAAAHEADLAARFEASGLRGDVVHRREEARFWLGLRGDATRAFALAKDNWDVQKEPWDARIFLEAASNAREAQPVLDWLATTRLEHPAIARAAARLKEKP